MGVERVKIYRKIELELTTYAPATLEVYTELPSWGVRLRYTVPATVGTGRAPVKVMLSGNVQGRFIKLKLYAAWSGATRLYSGRVLAKVLGTAEPTAWEWFPLPIEVTQEQYSGIAIPILPTEEGFSSAALPILPTEEGFSSAALPILPTEEGFSSAALPFAETQAAFTWVDLPID